MKRVIAMVITLGLAFTLFLFPVSAISLVRLNYMGRVTGSTTNSSTSIQMNTSVTMFYPESDSGMAYGTTAVFMITVKLYNPSATYSGFIYNPYIDLTFNSTGTIPRIVSVDNQSPDLYLGDDLTNYGDISRVRIYSSAAYSRGDGLIIPPGSSLYLVSQIEVCCDYDVANNSISVPALSSVSINGGAFALGEYSYAGDPTDLSQIQNVINTINGNTDQIESLLTSIKNELIPNANFYSPSYNTPQYFSVNHNAGLQYFYMTAHVYSGNSYIETDNIDHFDEYHVFERVVPITISLIQENYYSYAVAQTGAQTNTALVITDLLPRDQRISYTIGEFDSQVFNIPRIADIGSGSYDLLVFDYKNVSRPTNSGYCGIVPIGANHSTFVIYAHIRGDAQLVLNTSMTFSNSYTFQITDIVLKSTDMTLSDIYQSLNNIESSLGSGSYSDTIDESEDLQTTEAAIHAQEQQWYSDNQTAIEATGLGNYQYSQGLISSFGAARYQIAQVWNALADYTYVYYIVFLLGLATYILRHEPSMKVKQKRIEAEYRADASHYNRLRNNKGYRESYYSQKRGDL